MMIKSCMTALTSVQMNLLMKLPESQCVQKAEQSLGTIQPYRKVEIDADNQISGEKRFDLQIIMPAYNVEKYIERSIQSVICQNTKYSCLLVIINDGSTDRTPLLLDHYVKYDNVQVINQNNKGVAGARNRGLENIQGRYIMFLDPDDYLCEGAIEKLLDEAYLSDSDIVEGNAYYLYKDRFLVRRALHRDNGYLAGNNLRGEPWGKIFKADIFKKIKFPEHYYFEDTIFAYCIYPQTDFKYAISDFVYVYRKNPVGTSIRSKKEIKAVDTYYIIGYMWGQHVNKCSDNIEIQKMALGHMVLCFRRCKKLGCGITKTGFIYLADIYRKAFRADIRLVGKYGLMDTCVRVKSYVAYRLLCFNWRLME